MKPSKSIGRGVVLVGLLSLVALGSTSRVADDDVTRGRAVPSDTVGAPVDPARRLALLLRKLDRTARVLYVTAHPDDEAGDLIARLTHGDGIEVGLLTLTRGEGGQNEIGNELFHALGVLRSRELEAARRHDGARQYFGRAYEFGYSFSVEETFERWGRRGTVRDIVQVIREFRPDVMLCMWSSGEGGGQHHQASAQLAIEAFELAADAELWPELGPPQRALRLFCQLQANPSSPAHAGLRSEFDISGFDAVLGATYTELGRQARSQHKCQGMVRRHALYAPAKSRWQWFLAHGDAPESVPHPLAGLDEPLLELDGEVTPLGERIRGLATKVRGAHSIEKPGRCVDGLLELATVVSEALETATDPTDRVRLVTLRAHIAEALLLALEVRIAARAPWPFGVAGQRVPVTVAVDNRGGRQVRLEAAVVGPPGCIAASESLVLESMPAQTLRIELSVNLAADTPPTLPRPVPATPDPDAPLDAPAPWGPIRLTGTFTVEDQVLPLPPIVVSHDRVDPDFPVLRSADFQVVPDPAVRPRYEVLALPFPARGERISRDVEVLVSVHPPGALEVELVAPGGWQVEPATHTVNGAGEGREQVVRFTVTGPAVAARVMFAARARRADPQGPWSTAGYRVLDYPHIRRDALLVTGAVTVVAFPCERPPAARRVGYVTGTGDDVVRCLADLGVEVQILGADALVHGTFTGLDVIVLGVRAYKVRDDLKAAHGRLMQWIEDGGVLIVQYNKQELNGPREWRPGPYVPFPGARVWRDRVTDETAPIDVRVPEHPVFQHPNVIEAGDWQGWVQERGLYFLDHPRGKYVDLLVTSDPFPFNPGTKNGALVEARLGKGRWIYVGLGLFRQLPAGVPGSYRLLSNLLSLQPE